MWVAANPHVILEKSLYLQNVGVWCAPSTRITGPAFFLTTANTDVYRDVFQESVKRPDDREVTLGYVT
jgi:hypothetical protein